MQLAFVWLYRLLVTLLGPTAPLPAALYYLLLDKVEAKDALPWETVYGLTKDGELVCEGGRAYGERLVQSGGESAYESARRLLEGLDLWGGKTKDYSAVYSVRRDEGAPNVYHHTAEGFFLCRPVVAAEGRRLRAGSLAGGSSEHSA